MPITSIALDQLKKAVSLSDVAPILGVRPATLSFVLYRINPAVKYRSFPIAKKRGGTRTINAPNDLLKFIQWRLAKILQEIESLSEAHVAKTSILSHGFKKDLSIVTNASCHRNRRFVFNVDIHEFFPSINFGRVRGFFISNRLFELHPTVATVLAQIACHENSLPQGSPCSPVIANLITHILDIRLQRLATRLRCSYSRYADDITFSTNQKEFPAGIGVVNDGDTHTWTAGDELTAIITRSGFALNVAKTRMQYADSRQDATGLIVNKKINVPVEYYKATRAMCNNLFTKGSSHTRTLSGDVAISNESLRGRLNHIYYVRGIATGHKKPDKSNQPAYYKLYARFLNYIWFWGSQQTTIICEGKTDNIYIRNAIKSLAHKYPMFIENKKGKTHFKLSFFKYSDTSRNVQDLSGGNGQLKNLVGEYRTRMIGFKLLPKVPTIVITDVDSGAKTLFSTMASELGKTVIGDEPWYYLHNNLYVVPIPNPGGFNTAIEDLFEETVRKTKLDGKSFDKTNHETDGEKFYSKFTFATRVIAKSETPINFDGFEPLLNAIIEVQNDYARRFAASEIKS